MPGSAHSAAPCWRRPACRRGSTPGRSSSATCCTRTGAAPASAAPEAAFRFDHPILRFVPGLGALTRLEASTPGDGETLSRGGFRGAGERPFAHLHGAGFRGVFDLADPDGALVIIATGQSGHPLSDNWDSLLQRWQEGGVVRLGRRPGREAGRIRLTP
mgnify:CR=1 FL=1